VLCSGGASGCGAEASDDYALDECRDALNECGDSLADSASALGECSSDLTDLHNLIVPYSTISESQCREFCRATYKIAADSVDLPAAMRDDTLCDELNLSGTDLESTWDAALGCNTTGSWLAGSHTGRW
jgi:hypothetical protein